MVVVVVRVVAVVGIVTVVVVVVVKDLGGGGGSPATAGDAVAQMRTAKSERAPPLSGPAQAVVLDRLRRTGTTILHPEPKDFDFS